MQILAHEGRECAYLPLVLRGSLRGYKTSEDGKELTLYRNLSGESCILTATCILNRQTFPAVAEVAFRHMDSPLASYLIARGSESTGFFAPDRPGVLDGAHHCPRRMPPAA